MKKRSLFSERPSYIAMSTISSHWLLTSPKRIHTTTFILWKIHVSVIITLSLHLQTLLFPSECPTWLYKNVFFVTCMVRAHPLCSGYKCKTADFPGTLAKKSTKFHCHLYQNIVIFKAMCYEHSVLHCQQVTKGCVDFSVHAFWGVGLRLLACWNCG